QVTDEAIIESLFSSPFDRTDGDLRQKTIAFVQDTTTDDVSVATKYLTSLGYRTITVNHVNEITEQVDLVWLPKDDTIEQLSSETTTYVWVKNKTDKAAAVSIISGKDIVK